MNPFKKFSYDPQDYDDEPEIPEVDPEDQFDCEPDYDHSQEEMIDREGIHADNNGFY